MEVINNPALIIFSAVLPVLIALIKQQGFSKQVNALIALACYVVVGVLGALLSGTPMDLEHVVDLIAIVTLVGTAAYNLVWVNLGSSPENPNGFDGKLTNATSFVK